MCTDIHQQTKIIQQLHISSRLKVLAGDSCYLCEPVTENEFGAGVQRGK